jgi:hypothetical protein
VNPIVLYTGLFVALYLVLVTFKGFVPHKPMEPIDYVVAFFVCLLGWVLTMTLAVWS